MGAISAVALAVARLWVSAGLWAIARWELEDTCGLGELG